MKAYPPELKAAVLAAYAAGATAADVAEEYGIGANTVLTWTGAAGITRPVGARRRKPRKPARPRKVDDIALTGGRWVRRGLVSYWEAA